MTRYPRIGVFLLALTVSACSRGNNLLAGRVEATVGTHTVVVTDCYRTSVPPPVQFEDPSGRPSYRFMPCKDAEVVIRGDVLTVNGKDYGQIKPTDTVLVDHGKVSVSARAS